MTKCTRPQLDEVAILSPVHDSGSLSDVQVAVNLTQSGFNTPLQHRVLVTVRSGRVEVDVCIRPGPPPSTPEAESGMGMSAASGASDAGLKPDLATNCADAAAASHAAASARVGEANPQSSAAGVAFEPMPKPSLPTKPAMLSSLRTSSAEHDEEVEGELTGAFKRAGLTDLLNKADYETYVRHRLGASPTSEPIAKPHLPTDSANAVATPDAHASASVSANAAAHAEEVEGELTVAFRRAGLTDLLNKEDVEKYIARRLGTETAWPSQRRPTKRSWRESPVIAPRLPSWVSHEVEFITPASGTTVEDEQPNGLGILVAIVALTALLALGLRQSLATEPPQLTSEDVASRLLETSTTPNAAPPPRPADLPEHPGTLDWVWLSRIERRLANELTVPELVDRLRYQGVIPGKTIWIGIAPNYYRIGDEFTAGGMRLRLLNVVEGVTYLQNLDIEPGSPDVYEVYLEHRVESRRPSALRR